MPETIFYTSSNGDRWALIQNGSIVMVEHRPNASSGGQISQMSVKDFLAPDRNGPEHQRLREMAEASLRENGENGGRDRD